MKEAFYHFPLYPQQTQQQQQQQKEQELLMQYFTKPGSLPQYAQNAYNEQLKQFYGQNMSTADYLSFYQQLNQHVHNQQQAQQYLYMQQQMQKQYPATTASSGYQKSSNQAFEQVF